MKKSYLFLVVVLLTVVGLSPLKAIGQTAKILIANTALTQGSSTEVPVVLEVTSTANASGVQFDITLPEGIAFSEADVDGQKYMFVLNSDLLNSHTSSFNIISQSPQTARLVIYSDKNATLSGVNDNVRLGSFFLTPDDSFTGSNEIKLTDISVVSSGNGSGLNVGDKIPVTAETPEVYIAVESLSIGEPREMTVGTSDILTVTFSPKAAEGNPVSFSSSDPEIVSVDNNGSINALKVGTATITAKSRDKVSTCEITVVANVINVTKIEVEGPATLVKGQSVKFSASVTPDDATDKSLTWSSSDPDVASVSNDGTVVALAVGSTVITASAKDGSGIKGEASLKVVGVDVTSVTLYKTEASMKVGDSMTLSATVLPENAENKELEWTSSDETVAKVNNGVVTAVAPGTATITVKALGGTDVTASCIVTVAANVINVTKIEIEGPASLVKGQSFIFKATVTPDDASDKSLTWSSSDPEVASVANDGTVTALAVGSTVITASANDGSGIKGEASMKVVGVDVTSVTLDKTETSLKVGDSMTLSATVLPENAENKELEWTSSDETVAKVNNGVVTAVAPGTATITVKALGGTDVTASCIVTVAANEIKIEKISIENSEKELSVGSKLQLKAVVEPSNTTDNNLKWSSSDENIASVDNNGVVTGKSVGKVDITVVSESNSDISATITLDIVPVIWESLKLSVDNYEMVVGENLKINISGTPENADYSTLVIGVSPVNIVNMSAIDAEGNFTLTAVAPGEVTLTVKANDKNGIEAKATVKVNEKLELSLPDNELSSGSTIVVKSNTFGNVVWKVEDVQQNETRSIGESSKCDGAEIVGELSDPSSVEIKLLKGGSKVKVTATLEESSVSATTEFTVSEVYINAESIDIDVKEVTLKVGESIKLNAKVTPEDCTNGDVVWKSGNPEVASVNSDGIVSALSIGSAVIIARTVNNDGSYLEAQSVITVVDNPSDVENATEDTSIVKIENGIVTVTGYAEIYSVGGLLIAKVENERISGLTSGIYIVKIADRTIKIKL